MKSLRTLLLGSLCLGGSLSAEGIGIEAGPFNLQLGTDEGNGYDEDGYSIEDQNQNRRSYGYQQRDRSARNDDSQNDPSLNTTICQAIANLQQVEVVTVSREIVSKREARAITKIVTIEPYGFAMRQNGQPVLRGHVVSEKTLKEVTVKFEEDKFPEKSETKKDDGYFSGWFKSDDSLKNFDLSKVRSIKLVQDSHFDAPKGFEGFKDDSLQVICEVPTSK